MQSKTINRWIAFFMGSIFLGLTVYIVLFYYPYVFSKNVAGEIISVERAVPVNTIMGGATISPDVYSFAVAIRTPNGDIMTATSEDRQWAVVQKGQCATAKFFPYPPWKIERAGTYFGARLLKLNDCPKPSGSEATQPPFERPAAPTSTVLPPENADLSAPRSGTAPASVLNGVAQHPVELTDGLKTVIVSAELANSPETRARGLMFRDQLPAGTGMLFLFDHVKRVELWMKNCLINIDAAFFDSKGRYLELVKMVPCKVDPCAIYPSSSDQVESLIELPDGWLKAQHFNEAQLTIANYASLKKNFTLPTNEARPQRDRAGGSQ